jgi:hypothetical protein
MNRNLDQTPLVQTQSIVNQLQTRLDFAKSQLKIAKSSKVQQQKQNAKTLNTQKKVAKQKATGVFKQRMQNANIELGQYKRNTERNYQTHQAKIDSESKLEKSNKQRQINAKHRNVIRNLEGNVQSLQGMLTEERKVLKNLNPGWISRRIFGKKSNEQTFNPNQKKGHLLKLNEITKRQQNLV